MKARLITFICCIFFSSVALGGGGGSSSGGGGGGGGGSMVFTGTDVLTLSAPGVASQTFRIPITITVSGNMVTITDGIDTGTAPLNANGTDFIVPVKFSFSESGVTCRAEIIHSGKISGNNINGTISGRTPCSGGGISFTITTSGTFSATKTDAARAPVGPSFEDVLRQRVGN